MKEKDILKDQKGIALVVALVMLLILTLIGISAISTTTYETNVAGNQRIYDASFYAAESGIDHFRTIAPAYNPSSPVHAGDHIYAYAGHLPYTEDPTGYSNGDLVPIPNSVNGYKFKSDRIGYDPSPRGFSSGSFERHVFKVTAEGVAPSFPTAGRVNVEAIIEVVSKHGYEP